MLNRHRKDVSRVQRRVFLFRQFSLLGLLASHMLLDSDRVLGLSELLRLRSFLQFAQQIQASASPLQARTTAGHEPVSAGVPRRPLPSTSVSFHMPHLVR